MTAEPRLPKTAAAPEHRSRKDFPPPLIAFIFSLLYRISYILVLDIVYSCSLPLVKELVHDLVISLLRVSLDHRLDDILLESEEFG